MTVDARIGVAPTLVGLSDRSAKSFHWESPITPCGAHSCDVVGYVEESVEGNRRNANAQGIVVEVVSV